jgi:ADP-ribose pyrophosphatase
MPDGRKADWDILIGSRTVAIVAVTEDDQIVLVRQFRPGPGKVLAELPGGNVDDGEDVAVAAARELLEETGFEAMSVEVVGETYLAAYATHRRFAALARGVQRVAEPKPDREEFLETVTMPQDEFLQHVLGGELTDQDIALRGAVALGWLTPTVESH